jgi:hypothetical protein
MDVDVGEYCRTIESYLTRKNDGHLIRIRGPVFEQVVAWATRGIPLKIVQQGIDRYFERYYAKGPRRRPVQIEFCEPDVLDVFDEWRRAVGADTPGSPEPRGGEGGSAPRDSLPAHLERVIARLTAMRAGGDRSLDADIDAVVQELDAVRGQAKSARGVARDALLTRLGELDASLLAALRDRCDATTRQRLEADADEELRPYRARMPADAYRESRQAAVDRLLRERARLPTISYE